MSELELESDWSLRRRRLRCPLPATPGKLHEERRVMLSMLSLLPHCQFYHQISYYEKKKREEGGERGGEKRLVQCEDEMREGRVRESYLGPRKSYSYDTRLASIMSL